MRLGVFLCLFAVHLHAGQTVLQGAVTNRPRISYTICSITLGIFMEILLADSYNHQVDD